ncbi:hypothetical protein ONZ45_g19678 [Pleurotus djamor]|nr:hypothetical protein ONZ45_g19678 [Pleurotus djamor]
MVQYLVNDTRIHSIYTLDRLSSTSLHERQAMSFHNHSLDLEALSSEKLTSLEGNLCQYNFGLAPETYEKLLNSVTIIIHNRWMVNHNAPVCAFEPLIAGTVNLINFAQELRTGSVHFVFSSSITAVQNFGCVARVPDAAISESKVALGTGYGESKHIVERLLASSHFKSTSVRIPQLYLPSWPISGWLPFVIKSSLTLGRFPAMLGKAEWLPVNHTAKFLIEMALTDGRTTPQVVNLRHPHPVKFFDVLGWIQEAVSMGRGMGTALPLVPLSTWVKDVRHLQAIGVTAEDLPALRLLRFLEEIGEREEHLDSVAIVGGYPLLDPTFAYSVLPTLKQLKPLDKEDATGWVEHWIKEKFIPSTTASRL